MNKYFSESTCELCPGIIQSRVGLCTPAQICIVYPVSHLSYSILKMKVY